MLREDLIEEVRETYPAPDPPGSEGTSYLHCTRGPLASEPEEATRARDERIAGAVLARGLVLAVTPSFVQLLALLPWPLLLGGGALVLLGSAAGFARAFLNDWPLRPGRTLGLLAVLHVLFLLATLGSTPEAGFLAVLLPALLGLNGFANALAREFARWATARLVLDESEARPVRDAVARLDVPAPGLVAAVFAGFALVALGFAIPGVLALLGVLALRTRADASRVAAKEALVRFFSYNDHECYAPFVFQFGEPFRTPASRRAVFSAVMAALGCGLAAAANRPPAVTAALIADAARVLSSHGDSAWATIASEVLGWALRTAFIAAVAYPLLILSVAAAAGGALIPASRLLEEVP